MSENKDTGPEASVKGVVEGLKGNAKEAAGAIAGKRRTAPRGKGSARQSRS